MERSTWDTDENKVPVRAMKKERRRLHFRFKEACTICYIIHSAKTFRTHGYIFMAATITQL
jgi:hypothetical protein